MMPLVDLPQLLVIDAEPVLHVGAEVLDHHIGFFDQPLERGDGPAATSGSSVMLRLLRCRFWKVGALTRAARSLALFKSAGVSILMTLAPQSASWRTQVGPGPHARVGDQGR